MSTYMVFTRDKTLEVPATLAGMTSNFSLFYGAHEDLKGAPTEGTVILAFPNAAAKA